jgi:hypothetical protein
MPFVEQCVGLDPVGRVEAFGQPLVDRREEVAGLAAFALLRPQVASEVAARSSSDFACCCGPYPAHVALRDVLGVPDLTDQGVHVDIMTAYELLGAD